MNDTERKPEANNVYGENHPKEDDASAEEGIREQNADKEKSTAEDLDETRRKMIEKGGTRGGMGRDGTPSTPATEGKWGDHDDE